MIITAKPGKLKKCSQAFFNFISVSAEPLNADEYGVDTIFNMTDLLPTADMFMKYNNGQLSKKKFLKKYLKYISTKDTNIEYCIFSIGMALKNNVSICLTANEKEYRIGYVKVLAEYISELFGVEIKDVDEIKEELEYELSNYTKKERKLLKTNDEELSEKKIKLKNKITKEINKSISGDMSEMDTYDTMDKKFAIDQIAMVLINGEAVKVDKKTNGFKDIDADKIPKTKPYIEAMFIASETSKVVKKICKSVFETHQLKFKRKTCKKMDTVTFITLFGEVYGNLLAYRCGTDNEE